MCLWGVGWGGTDSGSCGWDRGSTSVPRLLILDWELSDHAQFQLLFRLVSIPEKVEVKTVVQSVIQSIKY